VFSPAIEVPSTGRRTEDVTTAMGLAASSIERAVRRAPNQWFVFREIWPA
jgi:predicted LPLAT superfamily acyltransferase